MADGVASRFNGVAYPAQTERHLAGVPLQPSGNLGARGGIRPGQSVVTVGGSPEAWTVAPHSGVIEGPADTDGSYTYAIPTAVTVNLPARPAAGSSRKDIIVARILDADVPATGSSAKEVDLQHLAGTATTGTPTAPSVPTGALGLATLTVPASGTITVASSRRTVALGGILPVSDSTDRGGIARLYDGLVVYREDTDIFEARVAGAWVPLTTADDTGWTNIATFNGAWADIGDAGEPAASYRRVSGLVHLRGRIFGGSTTDATLMFTLPSGFRPAADLLDIPAVRGTTAQGADPWKMTIRANGRVEPRGLTANTQVSLNGISFPVG